MSLTTKNLIKAIKDGKDANQTFERVMDAKVQDALDVKKIAVAEKIFNTDSQTDSK